MARQKKAKTAYELLERVCEAIAAHPANYIQSEWCLTAKPDCDCEDCTRLRRLSDEGGCGTAFCRAGWIVATNDGYDAAAQPGASISGRACELLGLRTYDTGELFEASAVEGTPGTQAYVRQGIAGLRAFMRKHAKHLKARSLRGV